MKDITDRVGIISKYLSRAFFFRVNDFAILVATNIGKQQAKVTDSKADKRPTTKFSDTRKKSNMLCETLNISNRFCIAKVLVPNNCGMPITTSFT